VLSDTNGDNRTKSHTHSDSHSDVDSHTHSHSDTVMDFNALVIISRHYYNGRSVTL